MTERPFRLVLALQCTNCGHTFNRETNVMDDDYRDCPQCGNVGQIKLGA